MGGLAPFVNRPGDCVRCSRRCTDVTEQRGKNFDRRLSNVDAPPFIAEVSVHRAGRQRDRSLQFVKGCIPQDFDRVDGGLESARQQSFGLHAIPVEYNNARKTAESDCCRHRECRKQRDQPQDSHQHCSSTPISHREPCGTSRRRMKNKPLSRPAHIPRKHRRVLQIRPRRADLRR